MTPVFISFKEQPEVQGYILGRQVPTLTVKVSNLSQTYEKEAVCSDTANLASKARLLDAVIEMVKEASHEV